MLRNLFMKKNGEIFEDGSASQGACYVQRDGIGYIGPVGVWHQRHVFVEISDEEWARHKGDSHWASITADSPA